MVLHRAIQAARSGDLLTLRELASRGQLLPDITDAQGAGPVHHAARCGRLECLCYLVSELGLAADTRALNRATPAHDAAATGHARELQWLVDQGGCNIENQDAGGATALHLAARFGCVDVIKWLLSVGGVAEVETHCGAIPAHYAAAKGDLTCLKLLVQQAPGSVNRQMSNGATPLYLACQEAHLHVAQYLVKDCGAHVHLRANDGMSGLHAAAHMGHYAVVVWLVTFTDLSVSCQDKEGATALHFAASGGHRRILERLLGMGAKVIKDYWGGTPLHDAAENRELECCKILLANQANPLERDIDGFTAADLADYNGHYECASYLRAMEKHPFSADQPVEESALIEEEVKGKTTVSWQPSGEDYYRCLSDTCRDSHRANTPMASLKQPEVDDTPQARHPAASRRSSYTPGQHEKVKSDVIEQVQIATSVIKGFTQTKVVEAAKDEKKTLPNACRLGRLKDMQSITALKDTKISGTFKVQALSETMKKNVPVGQKLLLDSSQLPEKQPLTERKSVPSLTQSDGFTGEAKMKPDARNLTDKDVFGNMKSISSLKQSGGFTGQPVETQRDIPKEHKLAAAAKVLGEEKTILKNMGWIPALKESGLTEVFDIQRVTETEKNIPVEQKMKPDARDLTDKDVFGNMKSISSLKLSGGFTGQPVTETQRDIPKEHKLAAAAKVLGEEKTILKNMGWIPTLKESGLTEVFSIQRVTETEKNIPVEQKMKPDARDLTDKDVFGNMKSISSLKQSGGFTGQPVTETEKNIPVEQKMKPDARDLTDKDVFGNMKSISSLKQSGGFTGQPVSETQKDIPKEHKLAAAAKVLGEEKTILKNMGWIPSLKESGLTEVFSIQRVTETEKNIPVEQKMKPDARDLTDKDVFGNMKSISSLKQSGGFTGQPVTETEKNIPVEQKMKPDARDLTDKDVFGNMKSISSLKQSVGFTGQPVTETEKNIPVEQKMKPDARDLTDKDVFGNMKSISSLKQSGGFTGQPVAETQKNIPVEQKMKPDARNLTDKDVFGNMKSIPSLKQSGAFTGQPVTETEKNIPVEQKMKPDARDLTDKDVFGKMKSISSLKQSGGFTGQPVTGPRRDLTKEQKPMAAAMILHHTTILNNVGCLPSFKDAGLTDAFDISGNRMVVLPTEEANLSDMDYLVPTHDERGRPIAEWKRQVMVRQLQTRLLAEQDQRRKENGDKETKVTWRYSQAHNAILGPSGEMLTEDDLIYLEKQILSVSLLKNSEGYELELARLAEELRNILPAPIVNLTVNTQFRNFTSHVPLPVWCGRISGIVKSMSLLLSNLVDQPFCKMPNTDLNSVFTQSPERRNSTKEREKIETEIQQFGVSVRDLKSNFENQISEDAEEDTILSPAVERQGTDKQDTEKQDVDKRDAEKQLKTPKPAAETDQSSDSGIDEHAGDVVELDVRETTSLRKERIVVLFLGHWKKSAYSITLKSKDSSEIKTSSSGSGAVDKPVLNRKSSEESKKLMMNNSLGHYFRQRSAVNKMLGNWKTMISIVPSRQIRRLHKQQALYSPEQFLPRVDGVLVDYDSLTLDLFMLGYFHILEQDLPSDERKVRHLLCFEVFDHLGGFPWETVREFHKAVIQDIEAGNREWKDGFDDIKLKFFGNAPNQSEAIPEVKKHTLPELRLPKVIVQSPTPDEELMKSGTDISSFSNDEICKYIDRSFAFWKEKEAEIFDFE